MYSPNQASAGHENHSNGPLIDSQVLADIFQPGIRAKRRGIKKKTTRGTRENVRRIQGASGNALRGTQWASWERSWTRNIADKNWTGLLCIRGAVHPPRGRWRTMDPRVQGRNGSQISTKHCVIYKEMRLFARRNFLLMTENDVLIGDQGFPKPHFGVGGHFRS